MEIVCKNCNQKSNIDKGRAVDGKRAYKCNGCGHIWTNGKGRKEIYSIQRMSYQFKDSKGPNHIQ